MKPIYEPKGRAKEYGNLALNIYTGCNHGCIYCYAPLVLKRDRKDFHSVVEPRKDIVEAVKRQIDKEQITGKMIHLCFSCDPYPADIDTTPTREIIRIIKSSGNHVQILTKGGRRAKRDFDLLNNEDWFGVTITEYSEKAKLIEPMADSTADRLVAVEMAHFHGVKTWVSFEPVYNPDLVFSWIEHMTCVDLYKIGKLNYSPSNINWGDFGRECERLCQLHNRDYYIKEDLRKAMGDRTHRRNEYKSV